MAETNPAQEAPHLAMVSFSWVGLTSVELSALQDRWRPGIARFDLVVGDHTYYVKVTGAESSHQEPCGRADPTFPAGSCDLKVYLRGGRVEPEEDDD